MRLLIGFGLWFVLSAGRVCGQSSDLAIKSNRGKELIAAGKFEEAIPIYRELVRTLPDNPGPVMNLGLALHMTGHDQEASLRIVETVLAVNDQRKRAMARKVATALGGNLRGKTIAVLGLTFKPNTDDMREAPSIALITALRDMGANVRAYDPAGMEQAKAVLSDVAYCENAYSCAQDADALVIVTEWEQFRALDLARLKEIMARPVVVDLRNVYRPEDMAKHGLVYQAVGRGFQASAGALEPFPSRIAAE